MYIIKNALRCISRSKGRNILIGIIVLAISVSACIGLSIRQAADNAKTDTLEGMSITATISYDRQSAMEDMRGQMSEDGMAQGGEMPSFDKDSFRNMMEQASSLTIEEYETYAKAETVQDFYYTLTAPLNGSDSIEPVNTEEDEEETATTETPEMPEGMGGGMPGGRGDMGQMMMGMNADFSVIGYSSDNAMTSFVDGTATISEGSVFEEGTSNLECIITSELATYNDISVGDTVTFTNPNNEEETYDFTVVGIYTDSSANEETFSFMGSTSTDPANTVYMSYEALNSIVTASEDSSVTMTDEESGREYETVISSNLTATYSFADVEAYEAFEEDVRAMGLSEEYTVSSSDLQAFENSLTPLNTLSKIAGYFLIVILIIGAVVLIVLNIFNVRERKYEIGVLCAMGMKKGKVASQFLCEIFVVTLAAVIIGVGIGGVTSVPVANALLEGHAEQSQNQSMEMAQGFGRDFGGGMPGGNIQTPDNMPSDMGGLMGQASNYITEINSAMNLTVVLQMLGIAVALTLVSGMVSMLFVMRYEPLKILANRD